MSEEMNKEEVMKEVKEEVKAEESTVVSEKPEAEAPAEKAATVEAAAEEPAAEEPKAQDDIEKYANEVVDKLKEMVNEGNVTRIRIRKGNNIILNLPINIGLIGTVIGLVAAPWALILGAISTVGFKCTVEVEQKDGSVTVVYGNKK